ncbi:peroxiredoxin-like family protein [Actibacterium ureilyticum]|uniref:peroxiredoxin-like family protein n=1 Tax=Actibacterium ureilyticum TaxID=1590614 RepID=UPI000BAA9C2D|nr:peroxiredoxin-like family protein [Actibacterium ureilyticum]
MPNALTAGAPFPQTDIARLGGGTITLGKPERAEWQLVFVYRGLHCPICKQYLSDLEQILPAFAEIGIEVVAISADTEAKAQQMQTEQGLSLPIGYDLSVAQMQALGLYISTPRSAQETDRTFAEPGLFLIDAGGDLHMVDYSNAPFLRPDLDRLPARIKYVLENDYPVRGTFAG